MLSPADESCPHDIDGAVTERISARNKDVLMINVKLGWFRLSLAAPVLEYWVTHGKYGFDRLSEFRKLFPISVDEDHLGYIKAFLDIMSLLGS